MRAELLCGIMKLARLVISLRQTKPRFLSGRLLGVILAALLVFSCTPAGNAMWKYLGTASGFGDWGQEPPQLEIHLIDVGKADAILIKSQGQAALLDAGQAVSAGEVIDYLYRHDVERLDYLIMSHPDRDHIGGMPQILQELPVAELLQPPLSLALQPESQEFSDLLAGLEELSVPQTQWWMGESIYLGGACLTAIGPVTQYDSTNNASLVLRLTYGDFTALFCGDMEYEAEQGLILSGQNLKADWLKVGHHGSSTSSSLRFLWEVSPQYAAISVGPDRNDLPREDVLSRLEEAGAKIYRTDVDGDILFAYDGKNLTVKTEK